VAEIADADFATPDSMDHMDASYSFIAHILFHCAMLIVSTCVCSVSSATHQPLQWYMVTCVGNLVISTVGNLTETGAHGVYISFV